MKDIGLTIAIYLAVIGLFVLNSLRFVIKMTIPFEFLLGMLSSLTLFCGLVTVFGDLPYAIHLIIVGFGGLTLSCGRIIYLLSCLLFALLKTSEIKSV